MLCYIAKLEVKAGKVQEGDVMLHESMRIMSVSVSADNVTLGFQNGFLRQMPADAVLHVQRFITCLEEPKLFTAVL